VNVRPLFVSNPQPSELIQPSEGPFDYPAPSPQSASVFGVALRERRHNAAGTQTLPDRLNVIATVAQYAIRTMPWASPLSLQAWDGVNQCEGLLRVVTIGSGQLNSKRNSPCVADQMALAAQLGPISRVRSRLQPPKTARIELPSTTARDQSISPQRANQSSREKWISCQMPASCQSRSRRQQVMPEPQPSSCAASPMVCRCGARRESR
jgi:hypothetical protein